MTDQRCGVVAVIGEPNAGKSTLVNRLVGGKVSIVTPKAQTTRFNVRGVCAEGEAQMIFVDTPGIFEAGRPFEKNMVKAAWSGLADADAVLLMVDAERRLRESTLRIIEKLKKQKKKNVCLAINKIDCVKKNLLLDLAKAGDEYQLFDRIFMISARRGDGVADVKKYLAGKMPPGPWLYPADQMSDIPVRLLGAEITREKIFLMLQQELPYAAAVETEHWEEKGGLVKISQIIFVEREGQKKIIIGKGGETLKKIGTASRKELERLLGKRVHLALFVKVKPDWKSKSAYQG